MSEVSLQIGGRAYKVACADGEEGHIRHLARIIDGKMASVGSNAGVSEAQSLLFAALFLADELDEARRVPATPAQGGAAAALELEAVAERLEAFADALEKAP